MIRYRKTKNGDWVAFGPAELVKAREEVVITKSDGTEECRYVERVGRPFQVDGVSMVYGYLQERPRQQQGGGGSGQCDECGRFARRLVECSDSSGLGGMCCARCAKGPAYERSFA